MENKKKVLNKVGFLLALCSGFLSAFNVIIEKKYIETRSSEMILFLMYVGAGIGLFRGILLEQIYRAFKIINNESYHK